MCGILKKYDKEMLIIMATIKEEFYFTFDGINSEDLGLMAVDLSGGLYEEIFGATRTVEETQTMKRPTRIFHGIKEEPRAFDLNLAFEEGYTDESIDEVARWLFKDYYRPLFFNNKQDRMMFAIISGDSSISHNGLQQGYITVSVQTNSPYLFSQEKTGSKRITTSGSLVLSNAGHLDTYPEFSIDKVGNGDLQITVDGRTVLITNLKDGESIYINTLKGIIKTDIIGEYRYNNIMAGDLEDLFLGIGNKEYVINGGATISHRYREMYRV